MSRPLAVAVSERLRYIETQTMPSGPITALLQDALPALARLVEWADVQASGDPYDNDRVSLNAALRDVAVALGVTDAS